MLYLSSVVLKMENFILYLNKEQFVFFFFDGKKEECMGYIFETDRKLVVY